MVTGTNALVKSFHPADGGEFYAMTTEPAQRYRERGIVASDVRESTAPR